MATLARQRDFIDAVASELASGIDSAVQCWMMQFEAVLDNPRLTMGDQMQALREILHRYKVATGKTSLECVQ
ncbi:MAG TPA: hypothetical protein VHR84_02270 [Terriglobales bacterium]|jgi:hypothetical protein|nr:hypothetical protein [Terriglobales bacterium]